MGKTLLVPVRGRIADLQELYMLNETGEFIWGMLDGKRTVDEIARGVAEEFDVSVDEALRDVTGYLEGLLSRGLARKAE